MPLTPSPTAAAPLSSLLSGLFTSPFPDPLASPLFAPIQAMLQARMARLACAAINHLLALEPSVQAHLAPHKGRSVLLRWESVFVLPAGEQTLRVNDDLTLSPQLAAATQSPKADNKPAPVSKQAPVDVTISVQAGIVTAPGSERLRHVRLEGDVFFAQDLSKVAQQLRWDAEHDLARVIGDTPAYWVTQHAQQAAAVLQQAVDQLQARSADALIHYPGWAVGQAALQDHAAQLAALKQRVDALAQRLATNTSASAAGARP
jgi:ubiquinone biosynthesis accessory factor UbiJ